MIFEQNESRVEHFRTDQFKGDPWIITIDGFLAGLSQYQRKDHKPKAVNKSQSCQALHQSDAADRAQRVSVLLFQRCDRISNIAPYQIGVLPSQGLVERI